MAHFDFEADVPIHITSDADVTALSVGLLSDLWDIGTWQKLLNLAKSKPYDTAKVIYERCLRVFPTCWGAWLAYLQRELTDGSKNGVAALLQRVLPMTPEPEIWEFHVKYVNSNLVKPAEARLAAAKAAAARVSGVSTEAVAAETEKAAAMEDYSFACEEQTKAFELAVRTVGLSLHSGEIWQQYVAFLKSLPENSPTEASYKTNAVRKAYQRGIGIAHDAVDVMWDDYCAYERAVAPAVLANKFIADQQAAAGTAGAVAKERAQMWRKVDRLMLPYIACDSAKSPQLRGQLLEQLESWRQVLGYELGNPFMVSKSLHHQYSMQVFRQYSSVCIYCVDVWHDFATFLAGASSEEANSEEAKAELVEQCYEDAMIAMPLACSIAFAASDFVESRRATHKCSKYLDALVDRLTMVVHTGDVRSGSTADLFSKLDTTPKTSSEQRFPVSIVDFPRARDVADAKCAVPQVFIVYMRVARRSQGIDACRAVFKVARESPHCQPSVYLAAAQIEYYANRALNAARNIIELGRKTFPRDVPFLLSAIDFLTEIDEYTNMRSLFESILSDVPPADSRPIYDRYIDYELRRAQGGGSLSEVMALEQRRAGAHPHLVGPHCRVLSRLMHRYAENDLVPISRFDTDFLERHPYHPFSTLPAETGARASRPTMFESPCTWLERWEDKSWKDRRDGTFLQAPRTCSSGISHVPQKFCSPILPSGVDYSQRSSASTTASTSEQPAEVPAFLHALLSKVPAFDPKALAENSANVAKLLNRYKTPPAKLADGIVSHSGVKRKAPHPSNDEAAPLEARPPAKRRGMLALQV